MSRFDRIWITLTVLGGGVALTLLTGMAVEHSLFCVNCGTYDGYPFAITEHRFEPERVGASLRMTMRRAFSWSGVVANVTFYSALIAGTIWMISRYSGSKQSSSSGEG